MRSVTLAEFEAFDRAGQDLAERLAGWALQAPCGALSSPSQRVLAACGGGGSRAAPQVSLRRRDQPALMATAKRLRRTSRHVGRWCARRAQAERRSVERQDEYLRSARERCRRRFDATRGTWSSSSAGAEYSSSGAVTYPTMVRSAREDGARAPRCDLGSEWPRLGIARRSEFRGASLNSAQTAAWIAIPPGPISRWQARIGLHAAMQHSALGAFSRIHPRDARRVRADRRRSAAIAARRPRRESALGAPATVATLPPRQWCPGT